MEIPARHPRKGDCIIRERTNTLGRVKVLVDYPDLGLSRRPEYLDELVDRTTGGPISLTASPASQTGANIVQITVPPWQAARQTLLALRLGQSTPESVRDLSVGMADVDVACRRALDRASTGQMAFILFVSPYGMGKSHALAHLRQLALARNMATGTVVLDGVGTSLCQPMGLISALSHAIEFSDGPASDGLPQRLAGLVRTGAAEKLRTAGAEFLHRSLANLNGEHVDDADKWETVEDYLSLEISAAQAGRILSAHLPPLRALRLDERPSRAADLLREWAQACTATGARGGLALLLDEADVDYGHGWREQNEMDQRSGLLLAWRQMADNGPKAGSYARLVVALAITPGASEPDPITELKQELGPHLQTVVLTELSEAEMRNLGTGVCRLYRSAYQIDKTENPVMEGLISESFVALNRSAEQRNPRKFIRLLLEKLDATYA